MLFKYSQHKHTVLSCQPQPCISRIHLTLLGSLWHPDVYDYKDKRKLLRTFTVAISCLSLAWRLNPEGRLTISKVNISIRFHQPNLPWCVITGEVDMMFLIQINALSRKAFEYIEMIYLQAWTSLNLPDMKSPSFIKFDKSLGLVRLHNILAILIMLSKLIAIFIILPEFISPVKPPVYCKYSTISIRVYIHYH